MKHFLILILTLVTQAALSQNLLTSADCELELHSVGKGETTPLHDEVEWMLKVKGYNVTHPEEFDLNSMPAFHMFGSFHAGDESLTGNADCLVEDFQSIGKRYTCSYELNLVTIDFLGRPVLFSTVKYAVRTAADSDEFYRNIREQLRVLPSCRF